MVPQLARLHRRGVRTRRAAPPQHRRQRRRVGCRYRHPRRSSRRIRRRPNTIRDLHRRRPDPPRSARRLPRPPARRWPPGRQRRHHRIGSRTGPGIFTLRWAAATLSALSGRAVGCLHRLAPAPPRHPMDGDKVTVYFIGAGPGAADLITVRGQNLLKQCKTCLYAGSIMPDDLLALCPSDAKIVDTGPLTLEQIVAELADADAAGHDVARLHSGDPSLYSALAEQCRRLDARGIDYEIVPGVPAFAAAAAALKRELTVPGVAQTVTLTRVSTLSTPMPPGEDLQTLARSGGTLVLHLAAAQIDAIVPELLANGYTPETPSAVVAFASWPQQTVLRGTLSNIASQMHDANITKTAVIVVGEVLAAEGFTDSYLYSTARRA